MIDANFYCTYCSTYYGSISIRRNKDGSNRNSFGANEFVSLPFRFCLLIRSMTFLIHFSTKQTVNDVTFCFELGTSIEEKKTLCEREVEDPLKIR